MIAAHTIPPSHSLDISLVEACSRGDFSTGGERKADRAVEQAGLVTDTEQQYDGPVVHNVEHPKAEPSGVTGLGLGQLVFTISNVLGS